MQLVDHDAMPVDFHGVSTDALRSSLDKYTRDFKAICEIMNWQDDRPVMLANRNQPDEVWFSNQVFGLHRVDGDKNPYRMAWYLAERRLAMPQKLELRLLHAGLRASAMLSDLPSGTYWVAGDRGRDFDFMVVNGNEIRETVPMDLYASVPNLSTWPVFRPCEV